MFNSVIASLLSTHKDSLTIRNICRRGNGINPCCTFIRAVLVRHARKLLPIVHGLGSNLVLLTVILAGIVRSGKRQRLWRDLTCGDGEVDRTALDRQCGLAVQGHVAVLISHSDLGIDGDGVGLLPSIDGLFNTAFCFCILHSFISIEFPLANEAVISRHTGGQAVGHSTAVQTADDILRDRRKSAHQAVSVAGIVGVSLVARLLGGDLVFQIVADCNFRVI